MSAFPKILIIDDEAIIQNFLGTLLAAEDIELLFAENGEKGLKMAREFQPDAILLDVMMPGMDGFETCRRIRADPDLAEIPIIMLTALDNREARITGLQAGADDFLTKPFDTFEMKVRIKNIMRLNRYRNLLSERSRFYWVVENDEKGYLILNKNGDIQYANQKAQVYFHLPGTFTGVNFVRQAKLYYQFHSLQNEKNEHGSGNVIYLVQPESVTARAFWLRVEILNSPTGAENQHLARVNDITDKMSTYQDIRKIHLLVAHKLRTPVSLLYSSMNLLDRRMDSIPVEEIKSTVKLAWNSTERLALQVQDILKYLDAPIALADGTPFAVGNLKEILDSVCGALELEGVLISLPAALLKRKLGISREALELISHEILENSKKFHPQQKPNIEVGIEPRGENNIQILFMDDGQPMTAEQITHAKMPYSQGEKWFTGEVPGMGLGIPLVSALVWQTGGQLRIENRSERAGVCVVLTLPILKEKRQEA